MKKLISICVIFALLFGFAAPVSAVSDDELDAAIESAAEFLLQTVQNPQVGSVGGCWTVFGFARSEIDVPDSFFESYFASVERFLNETGGDSRRTLPTDYSRVILALTAAGIDARDVGGVDLIVRLNNFENIAAQGVNSVVFALLALESFLYDDPLIILYHMPPQIMHGMLIDEILRLQLPDGGWNLTAGFSENWQNEVGEADLTAMAISALAKSGDPRVIEAIDRALGFLSESQLDCGGFASMFSQDEADVESVAQVIVALGELALTERRFRLDDPRFVKNGNTLLDSLLSFQNPDGGFRRGSENSNLMATEQAFYALVAARRAGWRSSLFLMLDTTQRQFNTGQAVGLPNRHPDVRRARVATPGITFTDIANHPSRQAIETLATHGIIYGRTSAEFAPQDTMTRAEFAAIITRGLGLPGFFDLVFDDVPYDAWFAGEVFTAYYYGIVNGLDDGTFNPNGTITRQEAAVMVARAARLCGMDTDLSDEAILNTLAKFGDSRVAADWAQASLAFAFRERILDDNEFYIQPETPSLRSEIAEMLHRLLERSNLL